MAANKNGCRRLAILADISKQISFDSGAVMVLDR